MGLLSVIRVILLQVAQQYVPTTGVSARPAAKLDVALRSQSCIVIIVLATSARQLWATLVNLPAMLGMELYMVALVAQEEEGDFVSMEVCYVSQTASSSQFHVNR
jgi:hypothetical protein